MRSPIPLINDSYGEVPPFVAGTFSRTKLAMHPSQWNWTSLAVTIVAHGNSSFCSSFPKCKVQVLQTDDSMRLKYHITKNVLFSERVELPEKCAK